MSVETFTIRHKSEDTLVKQLKSCCRQTEIHHTNSYLCLLSLQKIFLRTEYSGTEFLSSFWLLSECQSLVKCQFLASYAKHHAHAKNDVHAKHHFHTKHHVHAQHHDHAEQDVHAKHHVHDRYHVYAFLHRLWGGGYC